MFAPTPLLEPSLRTGKVHHSLADLFRVVILCSCARVAPLLPGVCGDAAAFPGCGEDAAAGPYAPAVHGFVDGAVGGLVVQFDGGLRGCGGDGGRVAAGVVPECGELRGGVCADVEGGEGGVGA